MTEKRKEYIVLDHLLTQTNKNSLQKNLVKNLSIQQLNNIKTIVSNAEKQKSVLAVLITSLLKKIISPRQDIRLHREEFRNGYSGRSLDTKVVTPWLKRHFPRFAPKESGWLTRSLEQPHPFNKNFPGKIRDKKVKDAFLSILDDVEVNKTDPQNYLLGLLTFLSNKIDRERETIKVLSPIRMGKKLTINTVIKIFKDHFSTPRSSRLPVVAVYTIYQILMKNVAIYKNKKLAPLKPHTTSDIRRGYGDIEVYYNNGCPYEVVEIKHYIPIDVEMINDVLKKSCNTSIKRYFILTTKEPNFKGRIDKIISRLNEIKQKYNIDIIPNGLLQTMKYYLRFVPCLDEFLNLYADNLKKEFAVTTTVQENHIKKWEEIISAFKISND
ncbi:MAG: DNA methyltransferase [candidate division WOR-3 bacterium]